HGGPPPANSPSGDRKPINAAFLFRLNSNERSGRNRLNAVRPDVVVEPERWVLDEPRVLEGNPAQPSDIPDSHFVVRAIEALTAPAKNESQGKK
ncbi:MAG TPA: hypothetical protein PK867_10330, partial [Pirellulales bacterium]|nr:hypothetical protein [Pirellulales bacterium]